MYTDIDPLINPVWVVQIGSELMSRRFLLLFLARISAFMDGVLFHAPFWNFNWVLGQMCVLCIVDEVRLREVGHCEIELSGCSARIPKILISTHYVSGLHHAHWYR